MNFKGPRERLLEKGANSLSEVELLAVILRTGNKIKGSEFSGLQVIALAERLWKQFGNLQTIFSSSQEELKKVLGLGNSKIATLLAVQEIAQRLWSKSLLEEPTISDCDKAYRLFVEIAQEPQEVLMAAFLTTKNQLILKKQIFKGSLNASIANPREILKEALRANAAKIIVAHNHPCQNPEPSDEDLEFTLQLEKASEFLGVSFVDHLIICKANQYYSFAETGILTST